MRFSLIDRIVELEPGVRISAVKALALCEEYLEDHFPKFPVMPGVLMLEALVQAGSWLVFKTEDFAHSVVTLRESRNVKFAEFVRPGEVLNITAEILKQDATTTTLKAQGVVNGRVAVSGRILLERMNMADRIPSRATWDGTTRAKVRKRFELLYQPVLPTAR
jgi:3-hydroxyacyl-[acyl-carrier-protein] dehydratase